MMRTTILLARTSLLFYFCKKYSSAPVAAQLSGLGSEGKQTDDVLVGKHSTCNP